MRGRSPAGAADIAAVVSDVKARLPELDPAPALEDPEQARFRLFDSIAAFLRTASQNQPLVLVLDDLHWADKPSLMLLQFVARELSGSRVLMVAALKGQEPRPERYVGPVVVVVRIGDGRRAPPHPPLLVVRSWKGPPRQPSSCFNLSPLSPGLGAALIIQLP